MPSIDKLSNTEVVFYGAGSMGCTIAAWLAERHDQTYLLARPATASVLRKNNGVRLFNSASPDIITTQHVRVIESLDEAPDADIVVLCVKVFDLEAAARDIYAHLGDKAIIVALQNGIENQKILAQYFSKVVCCISAYNAWTLVPGLVGYQTKGPLVLGTADNCLEEETKLARQILSVGLLTAATRRFQDAAHSKIVINLTNSVVTLVGHYYHPVSDLDLFQDILSNTLHEGVQIIKAAGFRQHKMGNIPSWLTIWASAKLPRFITRPIFRANLKKMVLSSMTIDVIHKKRGMTEVEYLNGYIVRLADQFGLKAPYNRAIYRLCREHFSKPAFEPLDIQDVWQAVQTEVQLN
jgi:2-dehydropantoate 2-reductase